MENKDIALITKLVLETIEKQKGSEDGGYMVPVGVSARACGGVVRGRLPAHEEKGTDGRAICVQ